MIMDGLLVFDSAAAITVTRVSTNVIDLLVARDMGAGDYENPSLAAFVTTAFAGGTSLQVQTQGSTDNTTFTTYAESRAYTTAELVAGAKLLPIDWPALPSPDALPRYLRLNYIVVGTMTGGAITAAIVLDRPDNRIYPAGLNVLN